MFDTKVNTIKNNNYRDCGVVMLSEDEKTIAVVTHGGKVAYHPVADILEPSRKCVNCKHSFQEIRYRCLNKAWQGDSIEYIPPFVDSDHVCKKWEDRIG
jgi:hypothetical protein